MFLRSPSLAEKKTAEEWLNRVNFNNDTLRELAQLIDIDLNLIDNSFPAVLKEYGFNSNGEVSDAKVIEFVRGSPERMELIFDKNGRFGRSDDGRIVLFCLQHRENFMLVRDEDASTARCNRPSCNLLLYPAFFRARRPRYGPVGGGMDAIYYTEGEILHLKKFTHNIGYGVPPIWNIWMKLLILLKQDWFILMAYDIQRPPKGILVMRGNREGLDKSWRRIEEEAKVNPHMIYPFVVEAKDVGKIAEWIDLTIKPDDATLTNYREETRRTVGALYGVMPIFSGGPSESAGLANEGLQVVVTNRTVKAEQQIFDEKIFPWFAKQLGLRDWVYKCAPSEGRDIVAKIQREQLRINNAMAMQGLGYLSKAVMGEDGIDFVYYEQTGEDLLSMTDVQEGTKRLVSGRTMQKFEGEPVHGRVAGDNAMEGGEDKVRNPKVEGTEEKQEAGGSESRTPTNPINAGLANLLSVGDDVKKALAPDQLMLFRATEAFESVINKPKFWEKYAGVSKTASGKINASIWMNLINGVTNKDKYVQDAISCGVLPDQAKMIVDTELAEIGHRLQEKIYKSEYGADARFKWQVNNTKPCEKCKQVKAQSEQGLSLGELQALVKAAGGDGARHFLVHPRCNCSFKPLP